METKVLVKQTGVTGARIGPDVLMTEDQRKGWQGAVAYSRSMSDAAYFAGESAGSWLAGYEYAKACGPKIVRSFLLRNDAATEVKERLIAAAAPQFIDWTEVAA